MIVTKYGNLFGVMTDSRWCGVITGDIVGSQQLAETEYQRVLNTLDEELTMLCEKYGGRFDIFRGDAFQVQLDQPRHSAIVAIIVRLRLKACAVSSDIRQSIGLGNVASTTQTPKRANGQAYVLSGNGLDNMKSERLTIHTANDDFNERFALLTRYLDAQLAGLTPVQSDVLRCLLVNRHMSHEALAATLNKTRSNVTRILLAANYHLVLDYLDYFSRYAAQESQNG